MVFFLRNVLINYCYHAMGENVAVRGGLLYEANRRALGTRDMVTLFKNIIWSTF